jgi:hypothetical protein
MQRSCTELKDCSLCLRNPSAGSSLATADQPAQARLNSQAVQLEFSQGRHQGRGARWSFRNPSERIHYCREEDKRENDDNARLYK